jgi:histidine phosphotransferase ChpT
MPGGKTMADMRDGQENGLRLAAHLVSRLCHDLSGPLHGLSAALAEGGEDAEALALAQEAAAVLRVRLALLRAAWGAPAALEAGGLQRLAEGLPQAHRLRLELIGPVATAALRPQTARLLLNALLLGAECLPRGGTLVLEGDPRRQVTLAIDGPDAAWPAGLEAVLTAPSAAAAIGTRRMQAALLALFAAGAGASARLSPDVAALRMRLDLAKVAD